MIYLMRILILILLTSLSNYTFSQSDNLSESNKANETLVGEWIIDLRPTPDAAPYLQSLIISNQEEKHFTGSFYGSPVKETLLNDSWDKLYFAFKSSDSNNVYYQSGYIIGDEIFGTTYCPARNFIMPWSGKKKKK